MNARDGTPAVLPSPLSVLLKVLAIVFLAEAITTFLGVPMLHRSLGTLAAFIADDAALILLSAPFLWWVVVRPLRRIALAEHVRAAAIIAQAAEGIITLNEQGLVTSFNPAAERLFGYEAREVVGQPLTILMPERYREPHRKGLERARSTGRLGIIRQPFELQGLRKDGGEFPLELSFTVGQSGTERFYTGIIRDITDRKRVEEELRGIQADMHRMMASIPAYVWSLEIESGGRFAYRYYSPVVERITGRPPEFYLPGPERWLSTIHPEDRPRMAQTMTRVKSGELMGHQEEEYRVIRPDGTTRWVHDSVNVTRCGDGRMRLDAVMSDITERKETEEALRETEARLRELFDEAPVGYHELDSAGRIVRVNRTELSMLGYTADEVVGRPVWEFVLESEASRQAILAKLAGGEVVPAFERTYLRKDGTRAPVLIQDRLLRDVAGRITGLRSTIQDISARKQAEEAALENQRVLEAVLETTRALIVLADPEGRILLFNRACEQLTGYSRQEVLGQPIADCFHDQAWASIALKSLVDPDAHGLCAPYEYPWQTKSGERRLVEWRFRVFPFPRDGRRCVLGTGIDITARKGAEEALRESEARYRSLFENSIDAVLLTIPDGRILAANREACRMFGRSEEEICQVGRAGLVDLTDPRLPVLLDERARTGTTRGELTFIRKDGTRLIGEVSSAVFGDHKGVAQSSTIIRDITDRKRAEEMLLTRTRQLEAVRAVSEEITRELDLTTLLNLIHRRAAELVGAVSGTVYLWDETAGVLLPEAWHGLEPWVGEMPIRAGEGIAGRVAAYRQGLLVNDYRTAAHAHPVFRARTRITAVLAEPLLYRERLVGVISLNHEEDGRAFSEEDREILRLFAVQAAIAIENARLHEIALQRAQQLATLNELARKLTTVLDPERVAQEIIAAVQALIPGTVGRLWSLTEEGEAFRLVASVGLGEPKGETRRVLPLTEGLTGVAAATRQPVISPDVTSDPQFVNHAWAAAEGLVSSIVLPLLYSDRVSGALVTFTREPHTFTDDQVGLLRSFAAQAAIALENAWLFETAKKTAREAQSLYEVTHSLTTSLDLEEVLYLIAANTTELLGTPHAQVVFWEEGTKTLRLGATYVTGAEQFKGQQVRLDEGVCGIVAQTRAPLIVNDYQAFPHRMKEPTEIVAGIAVPLLYRDQFFGVLNSHATRPGSTFSQDHLALLTNFADQAATAIQNARLFEAVLAWRERLEALSRRLVEAQEAERRSVARELHDEIGQLLTGLKLLLEMSTQVRGDTRKARLSEAQALVNELMMRVRELSLDLRPAMLDDLGLLPALLWHFERYTAQTKVGVVFQHSGLERRFPPEVETGAYRIVQEALNNVARHAGVAEATVRLWVDQDALGVQISDEGTGFDVEAALASRTSVGLIGMRERAVLLGGRLAVESAPRGGTQVTAEFPLAGRIEKKEKKR